MYEKDLVKQGINLTWSPKVLLEYASVTTKSESHPILFTVFSSLQFYTVSSNFSLLLSVCPPVI